MRDLWSQILVDEGADVVGVAAVCSVQHRVLHHLEPGAHAGRHQTLQHQHHHPRPRHAVPHHLTRPDTFKFTHRCTHYDSKAILVETNHFSQKIASIVSSEWSVSRISVPIPIIPM